MSGNYDLSYQVATVNWNGRYVTRLPEESYLPTFRMLKALSIREVMITGYVTVEEADFDMDEETKRLGGLLDSMDMKPAQHHGLSAMFAPSGESQDAVIEKLVRSVRYTANMNAKVLVIHPGHVDLRLDTLEAFDAYFHEQEQKLGRRELMRLCASNLDAAGEEAARIGVKIAVENVHLFDSDRTLMRDLLAESHSPQIGFCFDSGHAHCKGGGALPWLDAFGERMFTTHLHDNRGKADEHMPPGFGTIPWIDVIQRFRKFNYRNTVNFESGGWPGCDMEEGYRHAICFWRTCEYLAREKAE